MLFALPRTQTYAPVSDRNRKWLGFNYNHHQQTISDSTAGVSTKDGTNLTLGYNT